MTRSASANHHSFYPQGTSKDNMVQRQPLPADPATTPVSVDHELERPWTIYLRRQASVCMGFAYTRHGATLTTVPAEMEKKQAQPTLLEALRAVGIGWLVSGLTGMIMPRLKDKLKLVASSVIGAALKGKDNIAIGAYIQAEKFVGKCRAPLPDSVLQPGYLQSLGEFWQALGGTPKAALSYTVTTVVQVDTPVGLGPPVRDPHFGLYQLEK